MISRIRPARPEEAAALTALCLRSKAYWGYDPAFMEACADELTVTPARIARRLTYVCEERGALVGMYSLDPLDDPARIELDLLYVDPAAIGDGHGRALVEHARTTARSLGARLLVVQADPNAAGFYAAMGGVQLGDRPSESIAGRSLPVFELALPE